MPPQTVETSVHDAYAAVCTVLWAERDLLESLACTAVVARLIPHRHHGETAVRTASATERELVERLQLQEVLRAVVVEALAEATGSSGSSVTTLPELVADAPEPWATMLAEHREALLALVGDVGGLDVTAQLSLAEFLG